MSDKKKLLVKVFYLKVLFKRITVFFHKNTIKFLKRNFEIYRKSSLKVKI